MHWHLSVREWRLTDRERFSQARTSDAADAIAWSPEEVAQWRTDTTARYREMSEQERADRYATSLMLAKRGHDSMGITASRNAGYVTHVNAYAAPDCDRHSPEA